MLSQYSRRISRREEKKEEVKSKRSPGDAFFDKNNDAEVDDEKAEKILKRSMAFQNMSSDDFGKNLEEMIKELPAAWKIAQVQH